MPHQVSVDYCAHGQPLEHDLTGHPHQEELEDENDFEILAFYAACDCCGAYMHTDSPPPGNGVLQNDLKIFCELCDSGERELKRKARTAKAHRKSR